MTRSVLSLGKIADFVLVPPVVHFQVEKKLPDGLLLSLDWASVGIYSWLATLAKGYIFLLFFLIMLATKHLKSLEVLNSDPKF